jgi:hypothetical protein
VGEEGSGGRGREERVASGGVLSTDPGFTCAVRSGEEPTEPAVGGMTQRATEQEGRRRGQQQVCDAPARLPCSGRSPLRRAPGGLRRPRAAPSPARGWRVEAAAGEEHLRIEGATRRGPVASRISTDEIGMREGNILDWAGGKRCRVTKFLPPKLLNEIKIALFLKRNGTT